MKMEMLIEDLQTLVDDAFTLPLSGGKTFVNTERLKEIIEEMREEVEERTMINAIKNIMEGLKYTAQQAMELLKIPADDQPKYLAKL